jgi:hypothetical protein
VDHLEAEEAAARLAARAHAPADRERLLLRRIEMQEAHDHGRRCRRRS